MAANEKTELLALKKFSDVMEYGHTALQQFPRHQRYILAARIDNCMIEIMELIITANLRYHKKTTLNELDCARTACRCYTRQKVFNATVFRRLP